MSACWSSYFCEEVERLTQALDISRCSLERLPNGGVFFSVTHPPFGYEGSEAQRLFLLGEDILSLDQTEERPLTDEVIKEGTEYFQQALEEADLDEVKRYFQRARMIYSAIQDTSNAEKVENRLRWLEAVIEKRRQQPF
ncbi:MAG TPA: hypothetical protein VHZ51_04615 [Ktedonobacteraceae bacterium]|jgi:hypothetical protein|nr:hypothetical protein [Ktedonobacteraceae bacterium]